MIFEVSVLAAPVDWKAGTVKTEKQKYVANRVQVGDRVYRTWRLADHGPDEHVAVTVMALIDSDSASTQLALEA